MTYSMHGGAGALISVGLLKKVSLEFMEDCVLGEWSTGAALLRDQRNANRNKNDLAWQDDCSQAAAYDLTAARFPAYAHNMHSIIYSGMRTICRRHAKPMNEDLRMKL